MEPERVKILIVDDEPDVHKALALTLRREPYELLHADDAAEAWHVLESEADVAGVICDHDMPGTKGVDFLVRVRLARPEVATVLLTAKADLDLAKLAVNEAGVQGFLTKPWKGAELRELLRGLVLPEVALESPRRQAVAAVERSLREELLPPRDPETGAFLIEGLS
jgi:response regulator RpfG family c-di-GMP phosphodiesterase